MERPKKIKERTRLSHQEGMCVCSIQSEAGHPRIHVLGQVGVPKPRKQHRSGHVCVSPFIAAVCFPPLQNGNQAAFHHRSAVDVRYVTRNCDFLLHSVGTPCAVLLQPTNTLHTKMGKKGCGEKTPPGKKFPFWSSASSAREKWAA